MTGRTLKAVYIRRHQLGVRDGRRRRQAGGRQVNLGGDDEVRGECVPDDTNGGA